MFLHKDLTGADLHVNKLHADTHQLGGADPLDYAPVINVKEYGALGDGVTNDTATVQAALTALIDNQVLYFPAGTYLVDGVVLTARGTHIVMMGTLAPLTTSTPYIFKIDGTTTVTGNIKIDSGGIGSTYFSIIGLWMFNANQNSITVDIRGVGTGLLLQGDGAALGCCYNKFWILMIYDCLTSIKAIGTNHGWSNENTYYGGRFGNNSAWPDYSGVLFFDIGMNDYWEADSNHFIHPSIEGHGKLCTLRGTGHFIESARIEMVPQIVDKFIEIIGSRNRVSCIYDTMAAFHKKVLSATVTRIAWGEFTVDDSLGDVSGYFTIGKNIVLTLSDTAKLDALIIATSGYTAGVGTTIYLSTDVPALTIISLTVDNYYTASSIMNSVTFMGRKYADGTPIAPNNAKVMVANGFLPAITIVDEYGGTDVILQTFYLGSRKLTLYADGRIAATKFQLSALNTAPANAGATGTLGEIRVTADAMYVCTATNTWVKTALTTWA